MKTNHLTTTEPSAEAARGGRMTISPPAKVKDGDIYPVKPLCSGIDTLNLSINAIIRGDELFDLLEELKQEAQEQGRVSILHLKSSDGSDDAFFNVHPFGSNGYSWLLTGSEYALKIGKWRESKSRPNIFMEVRSEALWRFSPAHAVARLLSILNNYGVTSPIIKVSRLDLCLDVLFPEEHWTFGALLPYAVTRATSQAAYFERRELTGISLGRGVLSARIYDKACEIKKSGKQWMFDIWDIEEIPIGKRVIRVEFQLRREAIKELGLDRIQSVLGKMDQIWAYCTQKWLRFRTNPGKHHTQRRTYAWWGTVSNNFLGIFEPKPRIRLKAIQEQADQLRNQALGNITSLLALELNGSDGSWEPPAEKEDFALAAIDQLLLSGKTKDDLLDAILRKCAKYRRGKAAIERAKSTRIEAEIEGFDSFDPEGKRSEAAQ